jgi:hypothetical protein
MLTRNNQRDSNKQTIPDQNPETIRKMNEKDLTQSYYYVIETPVIIDVSYLYTYNVNSSDNSKYTNNLDYYKYSNSRNTIYYDDIIMYNPNPITNPYQGIQPSYTTGSYTCKNILNIFDLSKYVSNRLIDFINELQLVNRCNEYSSSNKAIPAECSNTFNDYDSMDNIKNQMGQSNKFPSYKPDVLPNKKKHLQQKYNDIKNLIDRLNQIIITIKENQFIPESRYNELVETNNQNLEMRNDLDNKLREIYEYKSSNIVKSRNDLDATVYSGVAWTILATSIAYIVFTKL